MTIILTFAGMIFVGVIIIAAWAMCRVAAAADAQKGLE
jgi:hypothetical protein